MEQLLLLLLGVACFRCVAVVAVAGLVAFIVTVQKLFPVVGCLLC